tara:strand:- start:462 stop:1421 length:960 start_codon:yes stop_codon:yes gene_type:complete
MSIDLGNTPVGTPPTTTEQAQLRNSFGLGTAGYTLGTKRSTALTFADLGFIQEMSENVGGNGFNGFPFDCSIANFTAGFGACNIGVYNATAPEDAGRASDFSYYWIVDTQGGATDLRFYDKKSGGLTPSAESFAFLSPSQTFAILEGNTRLTHEFRGDYAIAQGPTNSIDLAELTLEAGATYELDYNLAHFYAQGGTALSPEFVLASATAGMDMQIHINTINSTMIIDEQVDRQYTKGLTESRSWDVSAASNWNSTYNKFNTIAAELKTKDGQTYSVQYSVKATFTCTESTTCDLKCYNLSGGTGSLVDINSFRFRKTY